MKLFILADANSIHIKRWVNSLQKKEVDIFLFTIHSCNEDYYTHSKKVKVYSYFRNRKHNVFMYLSLLHVLRSKIREFKPDILHAHYASSYGLLGALANYHPYILSVWGSDVYDFPHKNFICSTILRYNLKKADQILSTSHVMAREAAKYTIKPICITPFGVDTLLYKKIHIDKSDDCFIVGNVKTLAYKYGIDVLIKAFNLLVERNPDLKLKLEIYGDGPDKIELMQLVESLNLTSKVFFGGYIENSKLPYIYNSFSVAVFPSVLESFGVAAVEAMACECPVVTSDADGFTEVIKDGETGYIVPKGDISATANAIQKFIDNPQLLLIMGQNGSKRVKELYDWNDNVQSMLKIYRKFVK